MYFKDIQATIQNLTNKRVTLQGIANALGITKGAVSIRTKNPNSMLRLDEIKKLESYFMINLQNLQEILPEGTRTAGDRLQVVRKFLNLTAEELAKNLGISTRTLGAYERNELTINSVIHTKLIKLYNVNIDYILNNKSPMFFEQDSRGYNYNKKVKTMYFKDLQSILQNLKTDERITQEKIGQALGVKKAAISSRCKNDSDVRPDEIAKIEKYFNVSLTDIDTKVEPKLNITNYKKDPDDKIIEIERIYDLKPACGAGAELSSDQYIEPFRISRQSIKAYLRCSSPENLKLFQATGDSMEDKISDGDWLLVDIGRRDASISGVYIFTANGHCRCKRLNITLDGSLEVKSDNPKYDPEIVRPNDGIEINIIGRVLNNLSKGL